jgi:hypothetical protein
VIRLKHHVITRVKPLPPGDCNSQWNADIPREQKAHARWVRHEITWQNMRSRDLSGSRDYAYFPWHLSGHFLSTENLYYFLKTSLYLLSTVRTILNHPLMSVTLGHERQLVIEHWHTPLLLKNFPSSWTTLRFISVFTRALRLSLSWARWI